MNEGEQNNYTEIDEKETLKIVFYSFLSKLKNNNIIDIDNISMDELFTKLLSMFTSEEKANEDIEEYADETLKYWGYRLREDFRINENGYVNNLEKDYGYIFFHLDLIYLITIQMGELISDEINESELDKESKLASLLRLQHVRSCSIFAEIIHLIKGGFGTGAVTRYRSLFELVVTMDFIHMHGEKAAETYFDYINVMKAKDTQYLIKIYGREKDLVDNLEKFKKEIKPDLINKYDKEFTDLKKNDYVWAKYFLEDSKKHSFAQISKATKRVHGREQYKLASNNIHSAPRSLLSNLGTLENKPVAGGSNIGLAEPGSWAVYELINFNSILIRYILENSDKFNYETVLSCLLGNKLLLNLAKTVYKDFFEIEEELKKDNDPKNYN